MDRTEDSYSALALVEWIYARAAPAHTMALFEGNVAPLTVVLVSSGGDPPLGNDADLVRVCRAAAAALAACPSPSPSIFLRVPAATGDDWLILACRGYGEEDDVVLLVGSGARAQPGASELPAARSLMSKLPLPRVLRVRR